MIVSYFEQSNYRDSTAKSRHSIETKSSFQCALSLKSRVELNKMIFRVCSVIIEILVEKILEATLDEYRTKV